jgi:hypothetical protein
VGVDVQTVSHAEVKINLRRMMRRKRHLLGVKELDSGSSVGAIGQR